MEVGYKALVDPAKIGYRILNLPEQKVSSSPFVAQYESRAVIVHNDNSRLLFEGEWTTVTGRNTTSGTVQKVSSVEGACVKLTFVGDYIGWVTEMAPDSGESIVVVDGETVAINCNYTPTDGKGGVPYLVFDKKLPYGKHTIEVKVKSGTTRVDSFLYHEKVAVVNKLQTPSVILVFDDSRATAFYDIAAPILAQHGFKATAYINPKSLEEALIDPANPNRVAWKIPFLRKYGWEITSHAYDHVNLSELTEEEIRDSLRKSVEWLQSKGLDSAHFAPPFGGAGHSELVRTIAKEFHASYAMGGGAWDPYNFNPYSLTRYGVAQATQMTEVWTLLDDALTNGQCFSMLFHGIAPNVAEDDGTNICIDKFTEIISTLKARGYHVCRMKDFIPVS